MRDDTTIGSVPYLNARPLVRWFADTEAGSASGIRVVETVPSALAGLLEERRVAAALVSSFELFRRPELCFAPETAIAADGPVLSVRLLSRVPIGKIESVALDTSSLTSVALLKILLAELYDLAPAYRPASPDLSAMLRDNDAALLIGDPGYREYGPEYYALDLGEGWKRLTGLPFVYALWIGHRESLDRPLADMLLRARRWGTENLEHIARTEFQRLHESYERTRTYLVDIMRYEVGDVGLEALRLFGRKSFEHQLLTAPPDIDAQIVR